MQFSTLQTLKNEGFFLVNWFGDDQWRFHDFSSKYALYFDACITTDKFSVSRYHALGQNNVIRSQHASFSNNAEYTNVSYQYDVSFVGAANAYRKWFVKKLQKAGITVHCFGRGWQNGKVSYDEMDNIFRTSKINLNISNSVNYDLRYVCTSPINILRVIKSIIQGGKNASQTKARIFEVPVRGGFLLTEYVPSLEDYFCIGSEVACYSSVDEAVLLIQYLLTNTQEREGMKKKSVERARAQHTFAHRVQHFMKALEIYHQAYTKQSS